MGDSSLLDKIKGGLYGVAIGDALGGTTEFMTASEVKRRHGYLTEIVGGGVWRLEPGEVTDDTMMTLCVAEGILANPGSPMTSIGERFLEWYASKPKDIGNIVRRVLSSYDGSWFEAALLTDQDLGRSGGNGTLMRCIPVALAYARLEDVERVSVIQSRMTHYDERCDQACVSYNRIVHRILRGEELCQAIRAEVTGTEYEESLDGDPGCEPSGFVVHSWKWALHFAYNADSFEETVQLAANKGGDSDTIGAIAGGLVGVYYGFERLPDRYRNAILVRDRLDDIAERLFALRVAASGN
ncbi:ADP-ribosylglycohydrolase family protein [Cohnella suwonensis]|uniref:ADP-ribosylglycohydrolase family protein n=1 Tax=Cohnella suwonensis TaxID=696072 RepID=A0ABW0LTY7_9BACL